MNRGARGWEPKVKVRPAPEPGVVDAGDLFVPTVDMIEVNGVWMTKEDAKHARTNPKRT